MRRALSALALLALGGCANIVISTSPWLTPDDARGGVPLRTGVWVFDTEGSCVVRDRLPIERWPACATAVVVRGGDLLTLTVDPDGTRKAPPHLTWRSWPYLLGAAEPRILQQQYAPDIPDHGTADPGTPVFFYLAIKPRTLDAPGRIVRFDSALVLCDGKTPNAPKKAESAAAPIVPLAGLTMNDDGSGCVAGAKDALVNAARVTLANAPLSGAHWVRDGWR